MLRTVHAVFHTKAGHSKVDYCVEEPATLEPATVASPSCSITPSNIKTDPLSKKGKDDFFQVLDYNFDKK